MILNRVKLENFISHKNTVIDLGYGINVVVGPNGAGKTSILDAISFALFNDYSNRGKKENLINSRAKRCRVGVAFTEAGINYDVEWSMERKGSAHGSLFRLEKGKKNLLTRDGERSVVPEIQKVLGIDKNMFLQSVYVRQGEIEKLVTSRPAERKELISRLLGVEDLEKAWETIKTVIQVYRDRQIELETELGRKSTIEIERREHEAKSKELEKALLLKRKELAGIEAELEYLHTGLDELREKKKEFDKLDKQKGLVEGNIANLEKALKREEEELAKAVAAEEVVKKLATDVAKLPFLDEYVRCLVEKERQELRQHALQDKLNGVVQLKRTLEENAKNHELFIEKDRLMAEAMKERRKYEGADAALETARKRLDECEKNEKKKSADLMKELEKCSKALDEKVDLDNLEAVLERKRREFQEAAKQLDVRIDAGTRFTSVLEQRVSELDENLSKFSSATEVKACPTCETELSPEHLAQLTSKFSSEKSEAETRLAKLCDDLKEAGTQKKQLDQKSRKIDAIDVERVKNLALELIEARSNIDHQRVEVADFERQAATLGKLDEELERLESEKCGVEEASKEFDSAKRQLDKLPSQEEIEAELKPIIETLAGLTKRLDESLKKLAYEPREPQQELKELQKKKEEYDQSAPTANRKAEYETNLAATTGELSDCRGTHSDVVRDIKELDYNEKEHDKKQKEYDSKNVAKNDLEKDIARTEQVKMGAEDEARKCGEELKALEEKAVEKKRVDGFIGVLNSIRDAYGKNGVQKMIRARARPLLEKSTRDLFERFNLAYSDIKIDDDYGIKVLGPSGEQDIDQISGGERVALAIALRLAIAQVLSGKVETIIMDEPTTHLDEERRKELVNILNSFFREGGRIIPQMLIITHHREIEEVADVVYTVSKKEGYSTAESEKYSGEVPQASSMRIPAS
ncbi:MAG: AAA family ATPase [Candidatus Bathyarchaeia archaeon]|jgi:exonuclease SbcC